MEGRQIDYAALTEPVTRGQVIAFRQAAAKNAAYGPRLTPGQATIAVAITAAVTIGVLFLFKPVFWPVMQESVTMFWLVGAIPLAVFLTVAVVCVVVMARAFGTHRRWERWMRLDAFARANSFDFQWQIEYPDLPGYLFGQGADEVSHDVLSTGAFQLGDFGYVARGAARSARSRRWGYIGVRIPHRVPHVVLRAHATERSLRGMTLPRLPHVLSLEGDFGPHFSPH